MTEAPGRLRYDGAAAFLNIPVATLRSMVHRKQIPHIRIGGRLVLFDRTDLERWLDERRVSASS